VGFFLFFLGTTKWSLERRREHSRLEFIWTITPALVLILIGVPRIFILYTQRVDNVADITLKVTGNQWFWSYNYLNFKNVCYDSFIIPITDLPRGGFRLLETDNRVIVPLNTNIRLGVCASDVLHAWAIPSIGLKVDAVPGRINFLNLHRDQAGLFFGQCSEVCGSNHSFIPIILEVTRFNLFKTWIQRF
jgi:cytochrome c oxidase subunit 2